METLIKEENETGIHLSMEIDHNRYGVEKVANNFSTE